MTKQSDPVFAGLAAGLMPSGLDIQERIVLAAERQATALENLASLFGACIGIGQTLCPGAMSSDAYSTQEVPFFRTGSGRDSTKFGCESDPTADDDDEL